MTLQVGQRQAVGSPHQVPVQKESRCPAKYQNVMAAGWISACPAMSMM